MIMNSSQPVAMAYGAAPDDAAYGYAPGVSITDFVPDYMKPMIHPYWNAFPPVNPMWHYLLGIIYCFLGFFCVAGNFFVMYLYTKASYLKTPANLLVANLALSDFIMMGTNCPIFVYNCFNGGVWRFSHFACEMYACFGAVSGVCSIWTLCMISFDRYNLICNGFNGPKLTQGRAMFMCFFAWAMGIGWALPPFFGWGKYIPEGILSSCSYDYLTDDFGTKSYNFCMFAFDYFVPLSIIIMSYTFIVKHITAHESAMRAQAAKMNVKSLRSAEANEQRAELRIAKVAMANISLWIICWTPYCTITLKGVLGDHSGITPLATMLPALLAKSASCYNPFVYALSHPKFRLAITQHMKWFCVHQVEPKSESDGASTTAGKE